MNHTHLFEGLLDQTGAKVLTQWLGKQGVIIHRQSAVTALNGTDELESITVGEQTLPLTLLGVGIGIDLTTDLAAQAGLTVNRGVVTNASFRTSDDDIFAVGDLAEFYHPLFNEYQLLGNWTHAAASARVAAQVIAGQSATYSLVSGYTSTALPFPITMIGNFQSAPDRLIAESGEKNGYPSYLEFRIRDNRLVSAGLINFPELQGAIRAIVAQRRLIPERSTTAADIIRLATDQTS